MTIPSRCKLAALGALLLAACGGGGASSNEPSQGSAQTASGTSGAGGESESMTLDAFTAEISREASPQLCGAPDAPLRACFEVEQAQCEAVFAVAMRECANQLREQLPQSVDSSNADSAARAVSECAGAAYRMGLEQNGLVRQTPECQPAA